MARNQHVGFINVYQIRVKGVLDEKWADWFEGFEMSSLSNGETLLSGSVRDQAALYGVLGKIHRLGLTLMLVIKAECLRASKDCPMCGDCRECIVFHAIR